MLSAQLETDNHKFKHIPLIQTIVKDNNESYSANFYDLSNTENRFNLILLDGPFGGENRYGFINYIESVIDFENFILIIDDTNRKEENNIANIIEKRLINDFKIDILSYSVFAAKYQRIILAPNYQFLKTV